MDFHENSGAASVRDFSPLRVRQLGLIVLARQGHAVSCVFENPCGSFGNLEVQITLVQAELVVDRSGIGTAVTGIQHDFCVTSRTYCVVMRTVFGRNGHCENDQKDYS
jgi:hypothetical protein